MERPTPPADQPPDWTPAALINALLIGLFFMAPEWFLVLWFVCGGLLALRAWYFLGQAMKGRS